MLSVSNSLPVSNYATSVVSLASGSTFKPKSNGKIRIDLPASLGMIDFHSSYLKFRMKVVPPPSSQDATANDRLDVYNMEFSNNQGCEQVIRDLRVLVDNKPVEEIQHYNILHKFKKDFTDDNSKNALDSTFNHAELGRDTDNTHGTFTHSQNSSTPAVSYDNIGLTQIAKLDCSGVLSLPIGFPVLATGKVGIEITLEDADRVLKPKGEFTNLPCEDSTTTAGGTMTHLDISYRNGGTRYDGYGWTNANDTPFAKGNTVSITATTAGTGTVTGTPIITNCQVTGGRVRISFADILGGAGGNAQAITAVKVTALVGQTHVGTTRAIQYDYEISDVEYIIRSIEMPPPYLQSLQKRIQQNAFMMDIPTYSSYLDNIQSGMRQQSINIPCFNSRVKTVLSVPLGSSTTPYNDNRSGLIDNLRNFQAQIGTRREPSRPIDLTNTTNSVAQYPSQEYLHELKKLFKANGDGVRTLLNWRDNFAFGRSLSAMGGSEDLSDKGFRFNVEYNADPVAKNVHTFVYHVKRLQVSPQGLQIYQ